jgi:hypothetical protein
MRLAGEFETGSARNCGAFGKLPGAVGSVRARLILLLLFSALGAAQAQNATVRGLDRTRGAGWAEVDGGAVWSPEALRVRFSTAEEFHGTLPIRGFFFDADNKLLRRFDGVPTVQMKRGEDQSLPEVLQAGKVYEVAFPIPPSIATGSAKWRTFIIEIGSGDSTVRGSYPAGMDFAQFDTKGQGKPAEPGADGATQETVVAVKSITRFRNGMQAWVNDAWVKGLNTLRVRLRVDSGAENDGFFARAYFFDKDRNEVLAYKKPPQVEVKMGWQYVSLPPMWKNKEDVEVFFPIPEAKERGPSQWRTAVIVFGNKQTVTAASYPATGVNLDDFSFPEKASLKEAPDPR